MKARLSASAKPSLLSNQVQLISVPVNALQRNPQQRLHYKSPSHCAIRAHLRPQQRQSDVRQQPGQVALPRGGVVADPRQQRGDHRLFVRHIDLVGHQQPLNLLHREQQELLASHHL